MSVVMDNARPNDPSQPLWSFVAFTLVENEHKSKYMLGLKPGLNPREYLRDRNINQEISTKNNIIPEIS
jgi:hypothetical protein